MLQELYQFVLVKTNVKEPFTIYKVLPRMPVHFCNGSLQSSNVHGNLLTLEENQSGDFFEFFHALASLN